MFLPGFARVFVVLNIIRALSIVALLLVFATSIVGLDDDVKAMKAFTSGHYNATAFKEADSEYIPHSTVPHQFGGDFWAYLNRVFIIFQAVLLVLSEIGWPAVLFDRFFPVLGKDFGVGPLGAIQCLLGASVLSHHTRLFPLVVAIFLFAMGSVNMIVGVIFRQKAKDKRSIFSWRERSKDVLPSHVSGALSSALSHDDKSESADAPSKSSRSGFGFGMGGEKASALKGFLLTKPLQTRSK